MFRFLLSRRWLVRILGGVILVVAFVRLGIWQLDRNEERSARNAVIEANIDAAAVSIDDVTAPGGSLAAADEWMPVEVRGRYDRGHQLALRLRPLHGRSGVHVLVPLVTPEGAVLVDRGFLGASTAQVPELPAPPTGEVTVAGRVRPSEQGHGPVGDPADGAVRRVDLDTIAGALPYPVYGGWLQLTAEHPTGAVTLEQLPGPEISSGPHLSYALQWFAFAVIGVGGFILLVRAESRAHATEPTGEPASKTSDLGSR